MIKHHQSEIVRRREVTKGWCRGVKEWQESDTGQWRGVKRQQEGLK